MAGLDTASNAPGIGPAARIDAALDFAGRLMASGAHGKANPQALEHLKRLRGHDRPHLASCIRQTAQGEEIVTGVC